MLIIHSIFGVSHLLIDTLQHSKWGLCLSMGPTFLYSFLLEHLLVILRVYQAPLPAFLVWVVSCQCEYHISMTSDHIDEANPITLCMLWVQFKVSVTDFQRLCWWSEVRHDLGICLHKDAGGVSSLPKRWNGPLINIFLLFLRMFDITSHPYFIQNIPLSYSRFKLSSLISSFQKIIINPQLTKCLWGWRWYWNATFFWDVLHQTKQKKTQQRGEPICDPGFLLLSMDIKPPKLQVIAMDYGAHTDQLPSFTAQDTAEQNQINHFYVSYTSKYNGKYLSLTSHL